MRLSSLIFFLQIFLFFPLNAQESGENIPSAIKKALKSYEDGDVLSALLELDRAVDLLVQQVGKKIERALPSGGENWEAGETQIFRFGKEGVTVVRSYTSRKNRDVRVKLTVTFGSPLLPYINSLMQNEFFLERKDVVETDGMKILFVQLPDEKGFECYTVFPRGYLVTLKGNTSREVLTELLKSIDVNKLH